jgi:hypothetical protein
VPDRPASNASIPTAGARPRVDLAERWVCGRLTLVTLAAVWVEARAEGNSPLCFASDSRTTPGPLEGVTKVVLFGRADLAGVWAGDYRYAMLLISHLDAFFTASEVMRRRDIDVAYALRSAGSAVRQHLRRSMNPNVPSWQRNTDGGRPEKMSVLVGGYSITESAYFVLRIDWLDGAKRWRIGVSRVDPQTAIFVGDDCQRARARSQQARYYREHDAREGWSMEPLNAIYSACLDPNKRTIGGAVQFAKAYMHGSTRAYAVTEPALDDSVHVRGTRVNARGSHELATAGLVVDLSRWVLPGGYFLPGAIDPP